ncbi:MAG: amidohydrolase family protein, partial [Candidatus Dormibacteraeota bacterium]|nr:amidohydrolase family protein [Candidatus Dormibacteraeota bacterium]
AEDHTRSFTAAVEARRRIAFGTDTGVGPHGSNGEEFLRMRDAGMAPEDCLRSATAVAAEVLGLAGDVGTLAPGAYGDLIGVPGDPLADLELVAKPEKVQLVVRGGEVVKERTSG